MKTILFLMMAFVQFAYAQDECDLKQIQSSQLDISVKDTEFLKRIMSFSYENETDKLIPQMKTALSGMSYKGSKNEPLLTYLLAGYKNKKSATQAFDYLKARWMANKNNQYDVFMRGSDVLWFGNNSLSAECFQKVVSSEKSKLLK